jgi:hypothetical protein
MTDIKRINEGSCFAPARARDTKYDAHIRD